MSQELPGRAGAGDRRAAATAGRAMMPASQPGALAGAARPSTEVVDLPRATDEGYQGNLLMLLNVTHNVKHG